ncbi:hypothetical protein [Streptomyces sp. NPDC018693]|uniref:hypothetical protein n=1 Tax=unclassified Streptomyces TaxID=2593676 RepID=UPI0037A1CC7F
MTSAHDFMPQPPPADEGVLRIRVDPGGSFGEVKLRTTPNLAPEMLAVLQELGADASYGAEFGMDPGQLLIVALMIPDSGAWITLRTAIDAIAGRHQGTRIRIELGDRAVEIEGKSTADMELLLTQAREMFESDAQEWQRISGGDGDGTAE